MTHGEVASTADLLALVPGKNQAVRAVPSEDGLVVWIPLRKRWWMGAPLGWVLPFRREKGVALDVLGREVFEACDGTRPLEQIIEEFARHHNVRFYEARASVTTFVRWLLERKIIFLARVKPSA